jgi:hypothetical protein
MKILLISPTRCGSTVLGRWITKSLGIEFDEISYNEKTFELINEDTLKKIVVEEHFPNDDETKLFDVVLCLTRNSDIESAISYIFANESNTWHEKYIISDYWLRSRNDKINKWMDNFKTLKNRIKEYNGLHITYENIYQDNSDIEILKNRLGITTTDFDYMLLSENRYRETNKNKLI